MASKMRNFLVMKINLEQLCCPVGQSRAGLIPILIALLFLAGCATGGKVVQEPVVEVPVSTEPSVSRFEDGRRGFVLTEISNMDAATQTTFDQAVELLISRDFEQAIELLEMVIVSSPDVTAPYINLAIAYRQVDKPEQAEEQLKSALEIVPGHPVASNEYGLLLRKAGRFAEAREIYERAVTLFPEYLPVRKNLGILCDLYLNDWECALEQYEHYSAADPGDKKVKLWVSELTLRLGR